MRSPIDVRAMYTPLQPANRLDHRIEYLEIVPDVLLRPFIMCYWEFKTREPFSEDFSINIVSDGCIDIFFEVSDPSANFLFGFCDKFTTFPCGPSFHYVGIRFSPAMFPYLFRVNASEFSNSIECLEMIHKETAQFLAEIVTPFLTLNELAGLFNKYFLRHVSRLRAEVDNRLYQAMLTILKNSGTTRIEQDIHKSFGVSPRHLRRLFDFYIGDSIKSFCKVVRFQNCLRVHSERTQIAAEKIFYDFGYYDQSHFIKEFKTLYGKTPGTVFK